MIYCARSKTFTQCVERANSAASATEIMLALFEKAATPPLEVIPVDSKLNACSICKHPVVTTSTGDGAPVLPVCGHVFHHGCIRALQNTQHPLDFTCPSCETYIGPIKDDILPRHDYDPHTSTMEKALVVCQERLFAALGCIYQARIGKLGGDVSVTSEFKFISTLLDRATSHEKRETYIGLMRDACSSCVQAYERGDAHDAFMSTRSDQTHEEREKINLIVCNAIMRNHASIAAVVMFVLMLDTAQSLGSNKEEHDKSPWEPFVEQWREASVRNSMSDFNCMR